LVTVRPRTGIHRQDYDFLPAIRLSLFVALATDIRLFDAYSNVRKHIEMSFWHEAVALLQEEDKENLRHLIDRAWEKLRGTPIRIPHSEHRRFHLCIFNRLDNPFVRGILEAYWEAYEAVELNKYADYTYLNKVWTYHERIAEAIIAGDIEASLQAYEEHTRLLVDFSEEDTAAGDSNHAS
jgi:DNA-binding FadR family transcriptional regulator